MSQPQPCLCGSSAHVQSGCSQLRQATIIDLAWLMLKQIKDNVINRHLRSFLYQTIPHDFIEAAMTFFLLFLPNTINKIAFIDQFILPWLLFNWVPNDIEGERHPIAHHETIAMTYLTQQATLLSRQEQQFILAMNDTHYSFYQIMAIQDNQSLHLQDLLLGTHHTLKQATGKLGFIPRDILFGRLLTLDEQTTWVGQAPCTIPATHQATLLAWRDTLTQINNYQPLTAQALGTLLHWSVLDYFFDLLDGL